MAALDGKRVALLESHLANEAAAEVRRFGGVPSCVVAVRETRHLDRVGPFIDRLSSGRVQVVVFLTGVGATMLLQGASRLGRLDEAVAALAGTTVACRGPKPAAVLRQHHVPVHLSAEEPYTSRELLDKVTGLALEGTTVALVQYGEPNRALADALSARGADVEELTLYEWAMPDDPGPLNALVQDLIDGRVDAVAFTNRVQCRHLFRAAADLRLTGQLGEALNARTLVAAIGPVCAEALRSVGVTPNVIPARATIAEMIAALADYVDLTEGLPD